MASIIDFWVVISMIAEIKGKISITGSNLNDRLEDQLTGDFFGSLRYIPFSKVTKHILLKTKFIKYDCSYILDAIDRLEADYWDDKIQFWPYDSEGELDAFLEFDDIVIGIEVKLYSQLSSDDDVDNSGKDSVDISISINQLSRESRILRKRIAGTGKKALLIFIAPEHVCYPICKVVYDRKIIESDIVLGYLPWEEIITALQEIIGKRELNRFEELIIQDLITLMKRKGLERFKSFSLKNSDVDPNLWFQFNSKKDDINFLFNQKFVIKEGYYEFK